MAECNQLTPLPFRGLTVYCVTERKFTAVVANITMTVTLTVWLILTDKSLSIVVFLDDYNMICAKL